MAVQIKDLRALAVGTVTKCRDGLPPPLLSAGRHGPHLHRILYAQHNAAHELSRSR